MTMEIKRIEHYWRAPSSVNSNPAFWVLFEGDERPTRTMSDAGFGYAVGNPDMRHGCPVEVEFTRTGRIRHIAAGSYDAGRAA